MASTTTHVLKVDVRVMASIAVQNVGRFPCHISFLLLILIAYSSIVFIHLDSHLKDGLKAEAKDREFYILLLSLLIYMKINSYLNTKDTNPYL